jgi:hypothetical protein
MQCPSFHQGLATRKAREEHVKSHDRSFKCSYEGCHYSILGFASKSSLTSHLNACHKTFEGPVFHKHNFPRVQRRSLEDTLRDAIDNDDAMAVRALATELSAVPERSADFLFRAVKKKKHQLALILIEVLGTGADLAYEETRRGNDNGVLQEVSRIGDIQLLKIILQSNYSADMSANMKSYRSPIRLAADNGHWEIVKLLLEHKVPDLGRYGFRHILSQAAAGGHEEVLQLILKAGKAQGAFKHGSDFLTLLQMQSCKTTNKYSGFS